ncbi:hypothetical protein IH86_18600 [Sphingobium yanoikuyae]|nr:hypothetical protein IH86_18600 [Sphingobium yanoikuyae]MDV3482023.1 hypothetical protein [Sphingobium yanoikuyae]
MSTTGVELFLDCHYRLCRLANELLPYGQTLFSALVHLRHVAPAMILDDLVTLKDSGLMGGRQCFVGAPTLLTQIVEEIVENITLNFPESRRSIMATQVFLVALKRFRLAASDDITLCYRQMLTEGGAAIKISKGQRKLLE